MKKIITLCVLMALVCGAAMAQPTVLYTGLTSTTPAPSNSRFALNTVGGFKQTRFQANQTASSGTIGWAFHQGTTGSPDYTAVWRPYTGGNTLSVNTFIPYSNANGARYNSNGGGADGLLPGITSGSYYTFNVTNNSAPTDNKMELLETNFNPVTISSVAQSAGTYGSRTVTITTSATPATGENIFVRYSTNSYSTSSLVQATGSGTTWTATIPWQSSAVSFYVYTSNRSLSSIVADVASDATQTPHDMATLNLNNNSGANYVWTPASGPIIVTSTGGTAANAATSYSTFTTATTGLFAVLNAGTVHTGTVTVLITADVTAEPGTTGLNNSAAWTALGIQPNGARTISGAATAGAPLIDFTGADNVTIDGLNTGGNSLTISNTTASATSGTSTIRFIGGATNNTITNSTILGSFSAAVGTNGGNVFFSTDGNTTNGNDNNTISNNNIGPAGANLPTKGIYGNGSTTTTAINNSNITISNNNIYDYFGAAVASSGIYLSTGNTDWTISNNKFYQTASRTQTTGTQHSAIWIANTSGNNFLISGNIIGYAASVGTGTYTFVGVSSSSLLIPIYLSVGSTTASSVQGNTIAGIAMSGAVSGSSSSAPFRGIYVAGGLTAIGNVTGNTIGSLTATNSITYTTSSTSASDVIAMFNFGSDNWTTSNNNIGGFTVGNSSTGASNFYGLRCNTGSTVTWTCIGNTIGGTITNSINSTSTATGTIVNGILNSNPIGTFTSNTIRNMSVAGGTGTATSASMVGIETSSTNTNNTISQNTIYNLTNSNTTAATTVTGIQFTGSTANVVERNLIYGLTSSTNSTSAEINGIRVGGGTTVYRNNMIALGAGVTNAIGSTATISSTVGINGINEFSGTDQFFHNSVYIGGSPTSGSGASFAFNGVQTTNTRSFRDNIFVNARSNSGATGKNYAIKLNGATANPTGLTINNNIYYTSGSGGVFGFYGTSAVPTGTDIADLTAWRTAVGQDANSFSADPKFLNPTAATPDLHLSATLSTVAEGNGADVGVTNDYDGQTRSALTPTDIGADAGNFVGLDLSAPVITYTALGNTASTANRTTSSFATITDASGVNVASGTKPRLYYKKSGNTNTFAGNTSADNGWKYVESTSSSSPFDFTIDYSLLQSAVTAGDVIQYFVVAQDLATTPNVGINSGAFAAMPASVALTSAAFPISGTINTYNITAAFASTISVGSGQTYTSLTNAGGLFATLNAGTLTGNITVNITSDLTSETGANALNEFASPYTITIVPSGAARTISGALASNGLIKLNGADRVTIDGSIGGGGTDQSLTITNIATTAPTTISIVSLGTGTGATNNTIKNCNISTGVATTIGYGISVGGSTPGTSGADNDNTTIQNNVITAAPIGIYANGTASVSAGGDDNLTITQNSVTYNSTLASIGIEVGNALSSTISLNTVSETTSALQAPTAISLETGFVSSTVTRNKITASQANNTSGYGGRGLTIGTGTATSALTISNNVIYGVNGYNYSSFTNSSSMGIAIGTIGNSSTLSTTAGGVNLYYNSVYMSGSSPYAAAYITACLYVGSGASALDIRNNVFENAINNTTATTGSKNYGIYSLATSAAFTTINYNDYYAVTQSNATGVPGFIGSDRATLAGIQAGFGQNTNSIVQDPLFTSTTNLLPSTGTPVAGAGTPISGITTDYNAATRSSTAPSMGAYEITLNNNDAGITGLVSSAFCTGSQPVSVVLKNFGVATLTSVTINWTVNGVSQTPYSWTGSLTTGSSTNVILGNYTFVSATNYTIVATTASPNGSTDGNTANDSYTSSAFQTGLSGTYTVGAGGNFTTLTAAVTAANTNGLCGPTVFSLTDATYSTSETFPIAINALSGASSTNTLIIKPASGVTATITGSNTSSILKLNGADYVTIDGSNNGTTSRNLTITNTSTSSSAAVIWGTSPSATDGMTNDVIKNTLISGSSNTTTGYGIITGGTTISSLSLAANSTNTIQNNQITAVQIPVTLVGSGSASLLDANNSVISNNIGTSSATIGFIGLQATYQNGLTISQNDIQNIASSVSSNVYGIALTETKNSVVSRNAIHKIVYSGASTYRIFALNTASGTNFGLPGNPSVNTFSNNLIYDITSNNTSATWNTSGINENGGYGDKFYFNTVYLNAATVNTYTSGGYPSAAFSNGNPAATTSGTALDIRNNIFAITGTPGYSSSTFYGNYNYSGTYSASTVDNNDLYVSVTAGTGYIGYQSGSVSTLPTWRTTTGKEAASISADPLFASTTNPQILSGSPAVGAGVAGTGITVDYAGAVRGIPPTIGGYETVITTLTLNSVTASPSASQCTATARTITANITAGSSAVTSATLYYSYNNGTVTLITMSLAGGSASGTSTWTGTIPAATPANAVVAYYVTASDSYVSKTLNGTAYQDAKLTGITATADVSPTTPICSGAQVTLTGTFSGGTSQIGASGTGTAALGGSVTGSGLTPFSQYYEAVHTQYLILASDLTSSGLSAGTLSSLSFNVSTKYSTKPFTSYTIKLGTTVSTTLSGGFLAPILTQVYQSSTTLGTGYTTAAGANTFTFASPYTWDGTSNIVVDICFANDPANSGSNYYSNNDVVTSTTKTYTATYGIYADDVNYCGATTGTTTANSTSLPNITFSGTTNTPTFASYEWSDGTNTVGTTNPLNYSPTNTGSSAVVYNYTVKGVDANICKTVASSIASVTVNPKFTVTASATGSGTISPSGATDICSGGDQTYTITPGTGYSLTTLTVDGSPVTPATTYAFNNVTAAHTITATFTITTYAITATSGANGTVTPAGTTNVNYNGSQTYTITPNTGYHILDVLVDGVSNASAISTGTYTFNNVTATHTISATFAINTYIISASASAGGSISPVGNISVNEGANQTFSITPNTGYYVASLTIDGSPVAAATTYTFTNVMANHTIAATFAINTYTITTSAGANGSITPANPTVNSGDDQTFNITPNSGYHVATLSVDGSSVAAATTYIFTNVTATHTIAATFAIDTYTITATSGANGTVTPAGTTTINSGGSQTYTITANTNYSVQDVLVDGVSAGAVTTYTFSNVTANHTISATFYLTSCPNPPTATTGSNSSVCAGSTYTFTAGIGGGASTGIFSSSNGNSGTFSPASITGSNVSVTYTPSAADIAAGSVVITLTTDNPNPGVCTPATPSFTLTINALPTVSISGNSSFCAGSSTTLTATATAGSGTITTYQWYNGNTPVGANSNTYAVTTAGTYTVVVTNSNNCSTTSNAISVSVNAAPTTSINGGTTQSFCSGSNLTLTSSNSAGSGTISTYQWNLGGSPISGANSPSYTVTAASSYTLTVTNSNGCLTTSNAVVVSANAAPTVNITGANGFCAGGSTVLTANATAGSGTISTYQWNVGGSAIGGANSSTYTASAAGSYTVTVTNSNGCSTTSGTFAVSQNVAPTVTASSNCSTTYGGSVTLTATATAGSGTITTYQWVLNGTTNVGPNSATYTTSTAGSYTVTVTNSNGCSATSVPPVIITAGSGALTAGNYTIGGSGCNNFANIAAAISYLNINGVSNSGGNGSIIFSVAASYTETAPSGGFVITGTGTSANPVVFTKASGTVTITSSASQPVGSTNDAVFKIVGADYITLDGFTILENAANSGITVATNTVTEFGIALYAASTTNGAKNNTIQNNIISLNGSYAQSFGILSTTTWNSATTTLGAYPTAQASVAGGENSNNKIYGNQISTVAFGILVVSPVATATFSETGNDIGGTSAATGNTISAYGNNIALPTGYQNVPGFPGGITVRNNVGTNIQYNTVTSISNLTINTTGIFISAGTTPVGVTYTNTISNNNITVTNTGTTPATGIDFGYGITTGTIVGSNNTIVLNQSSSAVNSAAVIGINAAYASATNTLNGNNVTVNQSNSTGATTSAVTGITAAGAGTTVNVTNNTVTIKQAVSGAGTFGSGAITYLNTNAASGTINVTGNTLNTTGSTIRSTGTLYGVFQDATVTTLVNVKNNTANIDRVAALGTAYFQYTSTSPLEVADTISNNNITFTSLAGTSAVTAINSGGGSASSKNINNNIISISGTHTGTSIGITASFTSGGNFKGNSVTITSASPTVTGITTSSTAATLSNNTLSLSSSTTSATAMTGISVSGSGAHSITGNTFNALNFTGVLTTATTISGIACSSNLGANIFNNTITNISVGAAGSAASPTVDGILISGGTSVNVYKNKIYGLTTAATGTGTVVNGIRLSGGAANNVYNNLIGNLSAPAAASADAIRGISITSTTSTGTHKIYYNTIYLNASSTGINFGTSGIYAANSTTSTISQLDLRNNIIINLSTPAGTGITAAYRRSAANVNLNNYASTSNNNMFYVGTPGTNRLILYDGTNSYQTFGAFQTAVTPRETSSFTGEAAFTYSTPGSFFISLTGSSADFLHLVSGITTQAESGGQAITSPAITDDYDGQTRPGGGGTTNGGGTAPDVGADEFDGVPSDKIGPTITYTPLANNCGGGARTLTATITDASGVPTSGIGLPVLYWKVSTATTYNASQATSLGSNQYQFTIGTGSAAGDVIQYYIVAQDILANVSVSPAAGAGVLTANPPAAATPPTTPSSYTNLSSLSGIYSVGTGGTYATLTAAIAAYNGSCVSGNVVFSLINPATTPYNTTNGETFPIVINANSGSSSTNTLTIKPASGVSPVITGAVSSGALIKLNAASYVTIDGSNTGGGTTKDLTITNSATISPTAISLVSAGLGNGAANNAIKNCNISTGVYTGASYGIAIGGATPGTSGADNDNITIQSNAVTVATVGIYANGTASVSAGGDDNLKIIGNSTTLSSSASTTVYGIEAGNSLNSDISGNTVSSTTSGSGQPVGISLETGFVSSTVTKNIIAGVTTTATGGYGGRGITIGTGSATSTLTVANNFVYGVNGSNYSGFLNSSSMGIGVGVLGNGSITVVTGGVNLYYNSINMYGNSTYTSAVITTALYVGSGASTLDIRNNIFNNSLSAATSGSKNYAVYSAGSSSAFTFIDNNDYYPTSQTNTTGYIGYLGADQQTLAAWKTATGKDINSVNIDAVFTSNTDLHLQTTSTLESKGTPITGITTDIDGQTRNATTPDIGADEYDAVFCAAGTGTTQGGTSTYSGSAVCNSGSATITATGYAAGINVTYQWEYSNDNFVSDVHDLTGQTTPSSATATVSSTTYFRLKEFCSSSSTTYYSTVATVTVNNPLIVTTTPNQRCGVGTVNLAATGSTGTTLNWYAASTGGSPIGTGSPFTTPSITATTTYYVAASTGGASGSLGAVSPSVGAFSTSFTGSYEIFDVTGTSSTISNVDVYATIAGTVVIELRNSAGTLLQTAATYTITAAQANSTTTTAGTTITIPVNFVVPAGTGYRLNFGSASTATLLRNSTGAAATYGPIAGVTITGNSFGTAGYYYNFYNWSVSNGCESARTPVTATVNTAPTFTVSNASAFSVCNGSTTQFTVTSNVSDFDTYTWTVTGGSLYLDAGATTPYTTGSSATTVYFVSSTAGTATVTANASNTSTTCTAIDTKSVTVLPATVTASAVSTTICSSGSTTLNLSPSTTASYANGTIQWQNSTTGTSGPWTDIAGANATTYTTPTITSTTYYQAVIKNSAGSSCVTSNAVTLTVNNPLITGTTPGTRCGTGTVTLSATGSAGTTLNWYTASTGGTAVGTGSPFTTPVLTATTTYYVGAGTGTSTGSLGPVNPSIGAFGTSFTGSYEIFDVTGSSSTINGVDVFATTAGTVVIELRNSSGTVVQTAATYTVTAAQANSTSTTVGTPITIPVNFTIPAGTGYRLNLGSASTATLIRNSGGATATYGPVSGITITGNSFGTAGYYYNFYNWSVSNGCESARTPVTATVNTAPTVSINASQTVLCSTSLSPVTLTASSSNDPNYTYSWPAPINATGATQTVNPTSTTTYTVNALDNSTTCTATASVTIMVNTPPTVTVSPSYSSICAGGSAVKLSASVNGGSAGSLLNETFESGLGSFTLSNGNLHTAGTASQWTVRSSSYTSAGILGYTYSSGSKFALADADAAGSGFRTQTYLTSSSVNTNGYSALTLAFRHHYNDFNNSTTFDDLAKVEVSTDGGTTWTAVQTYSSDVGSATSFASASLDLTAYANQANLKIRFNYTADYDIAWAIDDVTLTGTANSGYTWSPVAGLFTDAAATTVYTGDSRAFVYAKPTSNTTYTAAETSSSCGSTSTATVTVGGLSGIYSIGSTNISGQAGHFATLTQAIGAYNNSCLSGAVTFALTDASYGSGETFPITINSSSTASSTNTLTIKPNAGVTATISGNNATALFKFNGADYVSVDGSNNGTATRNLTITNTNTASTGAVIWLNSTSATDGATNNTVKNTIITGTTSTSLDCGIISSGSTYGGVAEVANANNAYQNDSLSTMYTGIAVVGPSGNETGTVITNNVIGSTVVANKMGASGIELYQQAGAVVSGNLITGITASSSSILSTSGIAVYGTASGINIFNNKIRDIKHTSTGGYGANGILLYSTSTANSVTMYNNFISDIAGYGFSGTAYDDNGFGIVAVQGGGYNIYDNTIYMATNQTATTGFSAAVNITNGVTTAASVNIVGNILSDVQTVGSVYSIYSGAANTVYGTIDYNDYFTDSTKSLGYVGSTTRTDLAAMQAGFGGNTHSVSVEPLFVSATDLHLTSCNSGLDGKGTPISGITTDIDGETRNASTPDIGADEFTSVIAAAAISVTPTLPVCAGTSVTLTETGGTATSWLWSTNATTQSIIVTPTVTTTYTVIATTGSCNLPKSIIVTVNPLPTAATVLPANPAICAGTIQPLTASAAESATLFSQNFNTTTAGTIPTGWTSSTVSTSSSWSAVTTTNAGGAANEMRFNAVSAPSGETGTYYLKSPVIDATGYTSLSMAFNFMLDNFSATTHPYTLRLQTSTDNNTWTDRWSVTPTGSTDISANTVTVNLGALDNSSTMYFRFAVVGEAYGLFYWYIDNAVISGIHSSTNIVWSPTTGLYTDAAAATPYAGGQATTVYAKPTATTIYTVTSSNGTCTNSTAKDTITVNPAPTAAFGSPTYEVCYGTAANISVTGTAGAVVHYHIGSSPTDYTDTLNASGSGTITTSSSAGSSTSNTTITYTLVSVTNLSSGCSQSLSGSTTLTIYALPVVAAISGPDYIAFGKTGSYSNTTMGGTWSISDPNGTGSTLSNPSANPTTVTAGTTAGTFTLSYTVTGAGGCTTTVTKTIQTFDNVITRYRTKQNGYATDPNTWSILNDNNVWVDANAYPGNNDNIEVRHNLSLLYADYDGTSNGIFKITDYDTVIGGVTTNVKGTVTIAATHFFQSQGSVDFNGRRVTLKSSTTGTAAIGVMTTPILNATNVQVERFTDGKPSTNATGSRRAWRLITSPVGGQTIHEAWQENAASNINPNPGYGTLITGIGFADSMAAAQQGYDWTGAVVTSSIKHYIAASNSWLPLSSDGSTTGTHVSVRNEPAYMLFVRGDRSVGAYGTTADTLRSTGTLQQSNQSLTFTAGNKFILAGNPYASTINFEQFKGHNSTLIQDKFYSWNSTIGTYGAYILVTHTGTGANNGGYEATPDEMTGLPEQNKDKYKYIPNGSGFFVLPLTSSTSGTLGFQETDKAPGLVPPVNPFKVVSTPTNVRQLLVNLNLKDSVATLADGFRAKFSADYEGNEEDNSTAKIYNFNENLNLVYGGKAHIIEARGEVKKTDTLYMKMWYITKRQYQLQLRGDNFATAPGIQAWLVDNYLGTKQELALGGSVTSIDFGVNSDSLSAKSDRFMIVFENNSSVLPVTITKVKAAPSNGGVEVSWTVANEVNTKGYTIEKSGDGGRTFTDMGTQQPAHNNPQAAVTSYSGFDATPKTGDNFYRIRIEGKDGSLSYSEVVKVTTGASGSGIQITLYPNPVREGKANLNLSNLTAGTYLVSVYTGGGQTVYQKKIYITLGGTTQTEQLILGSNIAQGSYQIKVSDNKGNILFNDQLIVGR